MCYALLKLNLTPLMKMQSSDKDYDIWRKIGLYSEITIQTKEGLRIKQLKIKQDPSTF